MESRGFKGRLIEVISLCKKANCDMRKPCIIADCALYCSNWLSAYDEKEYLMPWENWRMFNPIKKIMPIGISEIGFMYKCELCGKTFTMFEEIHIPWCSDCRLKELEKMITPDQKEALEDGI